MLPVGLAVVQDLAERPSQPGRAGADAEVHCGCRDREQVGVFDGVDDDVADSVSAQSGYVCGDLGFPLMHDL
jgi:hypothetical protein